MSDKEEYFIEEISDEFFDIKGTLLKMLNYWPYFVISISIALLFAFAKNYVTTPKYEMEATVTINEEENPFLSSNVSLMFNWGGASDKIQTVITILKSRMHNEKVVKRLGFEVALHRIERFKEIKLHEKAPFHPIIDQSKEQIVSSPLFITIKSNNEYVVRLPELESYSVFNFMNDDSRRIYDNYEEQLFTGKFNEWHETPFFKILLTKNFKDSNYPKGAEYRMQILNYNTVVSYLMNSVKIDQKTKDASILQVSLRGENKSEIVRFLDETIKVYQEYELEEKNRVAKNTLEFIDLQLMGVSDTLKNAEAKLQKFREDNKMLDVTSETGQIYIAISALESDKAEIDLRLRYYNYLNTYISNNEAFSGVTAPSVVGIEDPLLLSLINQMTEISIERTKASYTNTEMNPLMDTYEQQLGVLKKTLLESVKNQISATNISLSHVNKRLAIIDKKVQKLPGNEQEFLNIKRFYDLSDQQYNFLLEKRSEAGIVMAANMSDLKIIDKAKDIGQGPVSPIPMRSYIIAIVFGFFFPLIIILAIQFFNNTIQSPSDIENRYSIPLLGVIGHSALGTNLVVATKGKSGIAESFRSLRSNLQFLLRRKGNKEDNKTILITSSIGGEGKTYTSINLASVLSLGGKKTVLIGVDLRKPKIFGDFNISNDKGLSNYLIGQVSLDEVIQSTDYEFLDIISAGPIPPNPSELLLEGAFDELIAELKQKYDYIVLDTPPVGLVADAYQLMHHADVVLYMSRYNYTDKTLLRTIDEKYKNKEIENAAFILNDFESKSGYGYGYGYGYFEDDKESLFKRIKSVFKS